MYKCYNSHFFHYRRDLMILIRYKAIMNFVSGKEKNQQIKTAKNCSSDLKEKML